VKTYIFIYETKEKQGFEFVQIEKIEELYIKAYKFIDNTNNITKLIIIDIENTEEIPICKSWEWRPVKY
jgi:ribosomal protein S2